MKSFSQFLEESYLNEEPAGRPAKKRPAGGPSPEEVKARIDAKEAEMAAKKAQRVPTGAAARPDLQFKSTKVQSPTSPKKPSGAAKDPWKQFPKKPQKQYGIPKEGPSSRLPVRILEPAGGKKPKAALPPERSSSTDKFTPERIAQIRREREAKNAARAAAYDAKQSSGALVKRSPTSPTSTKSSSSAIVPTSKPSSKSTNVSPSSTVKSGGALRKLGKLAGPLGVAADVGLETMDQKSRGRRTGSALAMGATKAAGGLAGAKAGAAGGAAIGSLAGPVGTAIGAGVGGIGGYLAGSGIAGKASETVAGATGKEKAAMAKANRQRQAGTAIKGIGGQTTFSQKKPGGPAFMSTGSGSQRKTVQLAKTGVVQRGGQSVAGHLAFKGGKAVYKAGPSAQSLAKTSSNPLERIGRTLFSGAYKQHDKAKAQQALARARQSDAARQKALGVKLKPGK